jgi:hypothetical protein
VVTLSNSITSACLLGMAFFHFCSYNCKTRLCESVYFDWQTRKNDCKKLTKQPAPHITLRLQQNFDLGAGSNILASVAFLVPVYLVFASCSWEGGGVLFPIPLPFTRLRMLRLDIRTTTAEEGSKAGPLVSFCACLTPPPPLELNINILSFWIVKVYMWNTRQSHTGERYWGSELKVPKHEIFDSVFLHKSRLIRP